MVPLRALVDDGHEVVMVVSQPDRRRGRGGALVPSPVKAAALELGIPTTERVDDVIDAGAELGVVVAFGRIIRPHVLDVVPMLNVHFSLLPRWRGAAPVERAILAGDTTTGVCLMKLEETLDTGPIYACREVPLPPDATADELRHELVTLGTELLRGMLGDALPEPRPQEGEPTYASKIEPEELRLDWSRSAIQLHRVIRLGRAWATFRGSRLRILRARLADPNHLASGELDRDRLVVGTGDGGLELLEVQPEGRATQAAAAWRHGARLGPGERLG